MFKDNMFDLSFERERKDTYSLKYRKILYIYRVANH